jgi:DNA (cytosine-5)-methyltransferase 1
MKSSNPHSGVYEADTSRTLDNNGGNPACNQGGVAIVQSAGFKGGQSSGGIGYANEQAPTLQANPSALEPTVVCLEGNGSRKSHKGDGYKQSDIMYTLNTIEQHAVCCLNDQGGSVMSTTENITGTLRAQEHGHQPIVYDARGNGSGDLAPTITGDHQDRVTDYTALCIGNGQMCNMAMKPIANSLDTMHDQQAVMTWGLDRAAYNQGKNAKYNFSIEQEKIGAQVAKGPGAVATQSIVRRLSPMECERLQGYPDGWTDIGEWTDSKGKKHKAADSPRYKALGNSIALPFWQYLARRICAQYERDITIGSLFDGIGGFPLVFERCGAKVVWASEIEEFPIAVTKKHFPEEDV